jgi:thiol-disulfide isomerase/thioredoxin
VLRRIRTRVEIEKPVVKRALLRRGTTLVATFPAVLLLITCQAPEPGLEASGSQPATESGTAAAGMAELTGVTVEQWRGEIAGMRGDIVVADLWATWCIPCIERFPHMVEMYEKYRDQGVTFVSVCLDDPGDNQAIEQARRFLAEQQATFPNYLITENTADAFEKLDLMTIPAVFIYGADGTRRYRLTADDPNDQFTDQDVEDAVRELLAENPVADG